MKGEAEGEGPWYSGISRYQWLVLVIASLGWIFDVFEGQIFVAGMNEAMPALLPAGAGEGAAGLYKNVALAAFLLGGALGGVVFGALSDRLGRKRTMTYTILLYSLFTSLSALAGTWWQMAGFRFLVALGVGGEWAVASALVAEVFPRRARAWSQSIFHASAVLGSFLAAAAGAFVIANPRLALDLPLPGGDWRLTGWRLGFLLGAAPAVLILWVRSSLREPELWLKARAAHGDGPGSVAALFAPALRRRTLVGVGLAAVGLATFWGTHIYGKDTLRHAYAAAHPETPLDALKRVEMLGMVLVTAGGGLGQVAFGPLAERLGRRGAFLVFHLGGFAAALVLFRTLTGVLVVGVLLPVFGFLTLGMHAGYAVYFPELFPTRLRSTGAGWCFNVGRVLAAPVLLVGGWLQGWGVSQLDAAALVGLLFPVGALLLLAAPETKGQELPA